MYVASRSDIGKTRTQNQDTVYVSMEPIGPLPNLFIVADGMGGHNAGDIASNQAVAFFCDHLRNTPPEEAGGFLDYMVTAAVQANLAVLEQSLADPALKGMGTTFTACVLHEDKCDIIHVGDSRMYMITPEAITQLTTDHSYVNEMIKAGQISPSEAREHPKRNILTRVLGVDPSMYADGYVKELIPGCTLLLCSDGLTNMLPDEVLKAVAQSGGPVEQRADRLIALANEQGGHDNISVILIDTL